jgi:hypothetical protein
VTHSRSLDRDGTPIEDAPLWVRAILVALFWLIAFPAVVGLLAVWGLWHGNVLRTALWALALAVTIVAAMSARRWKRPARTDLHDPRPPLVRFSTWLYTAILLPHVLFGVLVLSHPHQEHDYRHAFALGLLVSAIHGAFAGIDRLKRWRAARRR